MIEESRYRVALKGDDKELNNIVRFSNSSQFPEFIEFVTEDDLTTLIQRTEVLYILQYK